MRRKSIVIFCGLLYIVVGLWIVISFTSFTDDEFNGKCLVTNPDNGYNDTYAHDNDSVIYSPEMSLEMRYYYDIYCTKKSIRMFDEYPCNCRQLNIDQRDH